MYKCNNNCGHISKKFFGICPSCGEGLAESIDENPALLKQMKKSSYLQI